MDPRWKHPFTAILSGPTGSGKTVFTFKFIREAANMINPPVEKIMYCFSEYQAVFNEYPDITFHEGLPDISQFDGEHRTLLIIDDLMSETNDSVSNIFTKVSHHRNVSVMYLTQNLFYKSKQTRTMSLNAHYIVLFKNPRDAMQISTLGRQMYPEPSIVGLSSCNQRTDPKRVIYHPRPNFPVVYIEKGHTTTFRILHLVDNSAFPKVTFWPTNTAKQKRLSWQVWDAYQRLQDHSKRSNNNSTYTDGQSSEPSCSRSFFDAPAPFTSTTTSPPIDRVGVRRNIYGLSDDFIDTDRSIERHFNDVTRRLPKCQQPMKKKMMT